MENIVNTTISSKLALFTSFDYLESKKPSII